MRIDRVKFCAELARKSWTVKKLSEISGVSRQTLSYVKQGKSCTDEVGEKIAAGLGVPLKNIIEG